MKNSFPVTYPGTDDEAQISLWRDKIYGKHFKTVYFKEESAALDSNAQTFNNWFSSVILIDIEVFCK